MKIIVKTYEVSNNVMRLQKYDKRNTYNKSMYIHETEIDEGKLWFNTLTGSVILLEENEVEGNFSEELYKYMVQHWFYINEKTDQKTLANFVKNRMCEQKTTPSNDNNRPS